MLNRVVSWLFADRFRRPSSRLRAGHWPRTTLQSVVRYQTSEILEHRILLATVYEADMNSGPGWTVTGEWQWGIPAGLGGSQNGNADPNGGFSGTNVVGINLNGDYSTAPGGPFYATTNAIDASNFTAVNVEFRSWLNTDLPNFVPVRFDVSVDNSNWTNLYANPGEVTDSSWQLMQFDISAIADGQSTVYLRWGYEVRASAFPYSGWNIDDVLVTGTPSTASKGEFIGVDFGAAGNPAPLNWNSVTSTTNNGTQLLNLIDETGTETVVDLTVGHDFFGQLGFSSPPPQQIPSHSNDLTNIDGILIDDRFQVLRFSELDPALDYEVYVFGGDPGSPPVSQNVTISGHGTPTSFVQTWNGNHFVNDQVATNAPLDSFAVVVTPSRNGEITILVEPDSQDDFAVVSALAIRSVSASARPDGVLVSISEGFVREGQSPFVTNITITRTTNLGNSAFIDITSSDLTELEVPPQLFMAAGESTISFDAYAVFDSLADGHKLVTVTASSPGYSDGMDSIFVIDGDDPTLEVQPPPPDTFRVRDILESDGAGAYQLAVFRNTEDTTDALTVNLSSDDPGELAVPSQVTIAAGASSVTFLADAIDDSMADGTQRARITASATGFFSRTETVYVEDDDIRQLTLTTGLPEISESAGNAATTATLTRNSNSQTPLTVTVTSDEPGEVSAPATVTIPAGSSEVTFDLDAVDDALIDGTQTATLTVVEAPGFYPQLDYSFGSAGRVFPDIRDSWSPGDPSMALQPDGKILVVGHNVKNDAAWNLYRYNPDGTPDAEFGTAGEVTTDHGPSGVFPPYKLRLMTDGRFVVLGNDVVGRYNPDGSPDTTFDGDGVLTLPTPDPRADDFNIKPDGSLVFVSDAGAAGIGLRTINPDGTVGSWLTVNPSATLDEDPVTVELQADGKIVIVGGSNQGAGNQMLFVVRLNGDGSLDTTFSGDGLQTFDSGIGSPTGQFNSVAFQPDGKIVTAGYTPDPVSSLRLWIVARYNADGTPDASFSGDGVDVTSVSNRSWEQSTNVIVQPDGSILVLGHAPISGSSDPGSRVIRKYAADGTLDASFANAGTFVLQAMTGSSDVPRSASLQPDGKLIVLSTGTYNPRVERYELNPAPLTASVSINVTDDDTGFSVSESAGATSVTEAGSTDTFEVVLDAGPATNVILSVTNADPGEVFVDQSTLTFTPADWDSPKTVTVTGIDDNALDGDQTTVITISVDDAGSDDAFNAADDQTVNAVTTDDDIAGFTVTESGGTTSVSESGTTDSFDVVLDAMPLTDVTISVNNLNNSEISVDRSVLTFTAANWNDPQTVTVAGIDDMAVDGDQVAIVRLSIDAPNSDDSFDTVSDQTVSVTTLDTNIAAFTVIESDSSTIVSESGSVDTFQVVLDAQPVGDVVLTVSSDSLSEATVDFSSLTFNQTNWDSAQTVTVQGVDDTAPDGDQTTTITLSVDDANSDNAFDDVADQFVNVTTTDDERGRLDVDGSGIADAATDGILAIRYLFGFGGQTLINNAISANANNDTAEKVVSALMAAPQMLDADGNGVMDAATDGILIIRFLFEFSGDPLVANAIGVGATRTTGQQVFDFLSGFRPPAVGGLTQNPGTESRESINDISVSGQSTRRPTFDWNPVSGAARYQIRIVGLVNGNVLESGLSKVAAYSTSILLSSGSYRVWIDAINATGTSIIASGQAEFEIAESEHDSALVVALADYWSEFDAREELLQRPPDFAEIPKPTVNWRSQKVRFKPVDRN